MPTISATFWNSAGEGAIFLRKKQNKSCCFQNIFNFPVVGSLPAAGIFCFFRQLSVSFRIFHFLPIHKIRKRGYQIQQIQFAMQKAASNTRKTITVSHSAIRHFLASLRSLVTAVAAGISVALTVLTAGAAATAIASKSTTAVGWKHCMPIVPVSASPPVSRCRPGRLSGYVGHTGRVTGNHLHLEVRINGSRTDAMAYFS